ncbi:MAG: hypothetical protein N2234_04980 [Planctomycetota bacterium]|nr:hypothetical protein [Planctomycetota bacterium]
MADSFDEVREKVRENPWLFITDVLGYELKGFHKRWFCFQRKNRHTTILAPRGHGKTTICNISYVLWFLVCEPDARVLLVSNTQSQARGFLSEIRAQVERKVILRHILGIKGPKWSQDMLVLPRRKRIAKEASVMASGVLGPIISRHFDLIILDDVVDEKNATSRILREKLRVWYSKVLLPTLEPEGELHILGTRYHRDDLYQHLIDSADEVFYF